MKPTLQIWELLVTHIEAPFRRDAYLAA